VVSVRNVTAGLRLRSKVLDDISFDIHARMTVAVVGESGSGKSTTARVITGLLPPIEGRGPVQRRTLPPDYRRRTRDQLRQAQMIYQMADTALNPKLKIGEIIGRPAQFYIGLKGKALEDRVNELLDLIELEPADYIDRYPPELSGGRNSASASPGRWPPNRPSSSATRSHPRSTSLVAEGILKLLDRLQKEFNLAYMFITHDLATVRSIADEVVVMKEGKVVEKGPKDEMFQPPHDPYTDLLLSSVPEMDPDWLRRKRRTDSAPNQRLARSPDANTTSAMQIQPRPCTIVGEEAVEGRHRQECAAQRHQRRARHDAADTDQRGVEALRLDRVGVLARHADRKAQRRARQHIGHDRHGGEREIGRVRLSEHDRAEEGESDRPGMSIGRKGSMVGGDSPTCTISR
jgi:ABC-type oligopeptide transport system ATPase subunit